MSRPGDIIRKLVPSLEMVREQYDAEDPRWKLNLLRTMRDHFEALGMGRRLIAPMQRLILDEVETFRKEQALKNGTRPQKLSDVHVVAAACVSALKDRKAFKTVAEATQKVAEASGLDQAEITVIRNNLNRGAYSAETAEAYKRQLATVSTWTTSYILEKALTGYDRFRF